jgi:hypothetical protein
MIGGVNAQTLEARLGCRCAGIVNADVACKSGIHETVIGAEGFTVRHKEFTSVCRFLER